MAGFFGFGFEVLHNFRLLSGNVGGLADITC
jgi:hypothetical protein